MDLQPSNTLPEAPPYPYIGRVIFSQDRPAKPNEFWCWLRDAQNLNVQLGSLLSVDGENERIIGIVVDMEYSSTVQRATTEFYGSSYGDPQLQPATRPTIIRLCKLRVMFRRPLLSAPPEGRWGVRHVNQEDLDLIMQRIPKERRILGGFIRVGVNEDDPRSWHPVYLHADFLLGPEGAHVNITGVTGLATKTSYALFLSYCIMKWAKENNQRVAIVLFNVKRWDFLALHRLPQKWEDAEQWIDSWARDRVGSPVIGARVKALWQIAMNQGIDIISSPPDVKYFTYQGDPDVSFMDKQEYIRYGLSDLSKDELVAALYRPDEEPAEQQINLISVYLDNVKNPSFDSMLTHLDNLRILRLASTRRGSATAPPIGQWDERTIEAVRRRLSGFLSKATHIIERTQAKGRPINFGSLKEGLNVIQLNRLHDTEKRLVVNAVIREISRGLESPQRHLDRVVIVIDELNKYAPKRWSPIKEQIVDVVARGRDLRLSLIGAQQFASEIDGEVLGNSSTRVVGRSDPNEIRDVGVYGYLGTLRDVAPYLEKGQMILYHPVHPAPFLIWFPTPLHEMRP